jgi:tRNA(fMet)-specific endonuclease VapC
MEWFLAAIQILPWDRKVADSYGHLRAMLESKGISIGNMDMQIAAHAIALDAILVTNDKVFDQISDIKETVNWATDL